MDAFKFLQTLLDQPLCYGLKSPDTDLYDFGFGDTENAMNPYRGGKESAHLLYMFNAGLR